MTALSKKYQKNGISVILPVHNAGRYLKEAVDSILVQQDVQLELIIIDDHSTDGSLAALHEDQRIDIITPQQRGLVNALNAGINAARMPWIARMDGDDIAHPQRLKRQLNYCLQHPHIDICGTQVDIFKENQTTAEGYLSYQSWINNLCEHDEIERDFFIESPIPHPTAFMRRSLIKELGGYHDNFWPEDYDLWCRALIQGKQFGKPTFASLLQWRDHSGRLSRTDARYAKQSFLRCKAHYLNKYLSQRNKTQVLIWGAGKTGMKLHDYLNEEGIQVKSFIDINPRLKARCKRGKPIFVSERMDNDKWSLPKSNSLILVAVSARGASQKIRQALNKSGLTEQEDFLLVA